MAGCTAHIYFYKRKCTHKKSYLIVAVDNHKVAQIIDSQRFLWKSDDLLSFKDAVSCSKSCVSFFLLGSCIARICFSRPTYCLTVNFLSAATFVSHILQNSILPSVEKMSTPNSNTIVFKWHGGWLWFRHRWIGRNISSNKLSSPKSSKTVTVNESTIPSSNIYIVERHVPLPSHLTGTKRILGGLPFWF
jgi:hypothetical protein